METNGGLLQNHWLIWANFGLLLGKAIGKIIQCMLWINQIDLNS